MWEHAAIDSATAFCIQNREYMYYDREEHECSSYGKEFHMNYECHRLCDLGARVIKVEKGPGGSNERGDRFAHAGYNYGKESIALDWMNSEEDKEVFFKLLATADVLIENYRAGTMEGAGLSWEVLHAKFPKLIFCSISGFGQSGPDYDRAAMDVVIQGTSGLMAMTGNGDQPAIIEGVADITAGNRRISHKLYIHVEIYNFTCGIIYLYTLQTQL